MAKIRVTQVKSKIGKPERQKRTMLALGLKKMNHNRRTRGNASSFRNGKESSTFLKVEEVK